MYAIKLYTHLHKQGCDFFRWLTLPTLVCVRPCVHRGNCLASVVF